ncbi:hypothetical protein ACHHYP_06617 [Achlya hypogyna]|uniref:WRKY19-like zinc finger domain-containing protein n=1 Tax=Achlya hypogyna TaxID=1202772 RepID=A0A1V9YSW6_ACHHY|nr:hypothetical protein ACHHYP_06617 [Achlya hypogyna]
MKQCYFNGCQRPSADDNDKCSFHKHRRPCEVAGCRNQVFARHRCVRHGGKRICTAPGCNANVRKDGLCARHGEPKPKRTCSVTGCENVPHRCGRCIRHGGGRPCHFPGCETHARSGGFCWRHRPAPPEIEQDIGTLFDAPLELGTVDTSILEVLAGVEPAAELLVDVMAQPDPVQQHEA